RICCCGSASTPPRSSPRKRGRSSRPLPTTPTKGPWRGEKTKNLPLAARPGRRRGGGSMHALRRHGAALSVLGLSAAGLFLLCLPSAPSAPKEDKELIDWLEERSMLDQARRAARRVSGKGIQWRHQYGKPRPKDAVRSASVWLLDYPG